MDYEKKNQEDLESAKGLLAIAKENNNKIAIQIIEKFFPELRESEDERIREELIEYIRKTTCVNFIGKCSKKEAEKFISWLEKQSEHNDISNVPSREAILTIWELGNEWKELTNGRITAECGTQLDYIQKHWHESDCCLKEKQGEQKPVECIKFDNEFENQVSHLIASVLNGEHEYNEGFVKYASQSLLGFAKKEQKPADKVEHGFKVGDWITTVNSIVIEKVVEFMGNKVRLIDTDGVYTLYPQSWLNHYHLWTIQDAKDGDVLAYPDGTIVIFKYRLDGLNSGIYMSHILLTTKIEISQSCAVSKDIHPATKEQRDLLFQKMKEAGYEWNAEKKELDKIEQNPSCREEDERMIDTIIYDLERHGGKEDSCYSEEINCLKSLKHRIQQLPEWPVNTVWYDNMDDLIADAMMDEINKSDLSDSDKYNRIYWINTHREKNIEWSEEDEGMYLRTIGILGTCRLGILPTKVEEELKWLKSVKPQQNRYGKGFKDGYSAAKYNNWKPSEEQMEIIENLLACEMPPRHKKIFESLYNDLKNLRS